jgi:hypothetical protein
MDFPITNTIGDYIVQALNPSLYGIAREQALQKYGGLYTLDGLNTTHSQNNQTLLRITTDAGPGLLVDLQVNGHSIKEWSPKSDPGSLIPRIYPMIMANANPGTTYFRMLLQNAADSSCISWLNVDGDNYGNRALDEFVFEVGLNGTVQSVLNSGLRLRLKKV